MPPTPPIKYHPDHLGSASWITDSSGQAVQHMQYLPYGETKLDQRTSSYHERYTFSGKEKDSETGYYYFGARYYNSDLSLWLSVDPMADKYPSLSPYNYCAWNPMKIVDPNGDSVFITGDDASKKEALRQIQQKSSNLTFSIDGNNMLTCKGNAKTKMEKYMKKIIESKNTNVDLCVQNNSSYRDQTIGFGGFDGNTLSNDGTMVFASQVVNVLETNKWDKKCMNPGNGIWHEIAEAYEGGLISLNAQVDAQPALVGARNPIYDKAHYNAGAFFPGTIEPTTVAYPKELLPTIEKINNLLGKEYGTTYKKYNYVRQ